ncbi:NAD(P)-binding protein [Polyplosphaeria fusca]|uniref:NAD(P)-binding protein n=1 Tax=Polyplosphaeria fusca TaxID=682080 RepID=A0A9P4QG32_9PLEO|nr:NAD(P)-binding protein [Polyplosphaeria fusca]
MKPPYPSPTASWHNDKYPTIDPSHPNLSQNGKTVVVTGAGSGVGRATALAFAVAGAERLILIGRTSSTLQETQGMLKEGAPHVDCMVCPASVTDEVKVKDIARDIGPWDVLVLNAGYISSPSTIVNDSVQSWWNNYEVNVKSVVVAAQAFIPNAKPDASLFAVTAGAAVLPPAYTPYLSGYLSSKVAQVKLVEFLAAEHPEIFVCAVHPGMIETDIFKVSGADPTQLPMDTVDLPACFMLWLSQPKAKFLHGKAVWANWDVEELQARAEEIRTSQMMTFGFEGWPFSPVSGS